MNIIDENYSTCYFKLLTILLCFIFIFLTTSSSQGTQGTKQPLASSSRSS